MKAVDFEKEIISVYRGYGLVLNLLVQRNCAKVDLSGAQLLTQVFDGNKHLLFKICSSNILADGQATIVMYPWQTDLPSGDYDMSIKLFEKDGNTNTIFPAQVGGCGILRIRDLKQ